MFARSIPPAAVFACWTSFNSSDAIDRCFRSGWASGDSRIGSMASSGLIRCARMITFGSATSRTLSGPVWVLLSLRSLGGGSYISMTINDRVYTFSLTGIPAGRNRSKLCAGIMKQSRSMVASETGSLRVPYVFPGPPKLTEIITN